MIKAGVIEWLKSRDYLHKSTHPITHTFDLGRFREDLRETQGNVFIGDERLTWVLKDLLCCNVSFAEWEDRKGERIIGDCTYFAWKLLVPEVRWLVIAGCEALTDKYFLVNAPDDGEKIDIDSCDSILFREEIVP